MPKVNTFVLLQNAKEELKRLQYEVANARLVSTLFCADAAVIAAHEVFQRKGGHHSGVPGILPDVVPADCKAGRR